MIKNDEIVSVNFLALSVSEVQLWVHRETLMRKWQQCFLVGDLTGTEDRTRVR